MPALTPIPIPINKWHTDDTRNSYEWGYRLSAVIDVALCALEQIAPPTPDQVEILVDQILEWQGGEDARLDGKALYEGVRDGSARYRAVVAAKARAA